MSWRGEVESISLGWWGSVSEEWCDLTERVDEDRELEVRRIFFSGEGDEICWRRKMALALPRRERDGLLSSCLMRQGTSPHSSISGTVQKA